MKKHLVIGAAGQLGVELVLALQAKYRPEHVVVADIRTPEDDNVLRSPFIHLDATDRDAMRAVFQGSSYASVYHLAAMLSVVGEQRPLAAWDLNMDSLLNVLECAREGGGHAGFLAQFDCGVWPGYPERPGPPRRAAGSHDRVWHFEASRRMVVRLLPPPLWS